MTKFIKAALSSLIFMCAFSATAGEALDTINAQVAQQAEAIDQKFGVLLTTQERENLKVALIVKKVVAETPIDATVDVATKTNKAVETYEITDPTQQRTLLIELDAAMAAGGGGGKQPPPPPPPS